MAAFEDTSALQAQATERNNPHDLPFDVLRYYVKKLKGNKCTTCGDDRMVEKHGKLHSLNTVARVRGTEDAFNTLEVFCLKHNPEKE